MTGTPLTLRTRHGESPITAARTTDFLLSVRKGIAFQSVPLHSGSSGGSTRHSPTLHSIALLYTLRPFGRSRKKAVGQADSTLSAKSGMAEAMDKKAVRLLCRARPTGGLPFYPSPLPHYRPMSRAAPLGQYVGQWLVSASRKSPYQAETPRFFFGVRSLQP